jgi:hypothetical protein
VHGDTFRLLTQPSSGQLTVKQAPQCARGLIQLKYLAYFILPDLLSLPLSLSLSHTRACNHARTERYPFISEEYDILHKETRSHLEVQSMLHPWHSAHIRRRQIQPVCTAPDDSLEQ